MNEARHDETKHPPSDTARFDTLLEDQGIDVLVATSKHNVQYLYHAFVGKVGKTKTTVEHLGLLVGKETLAARLLAHFGSLKTLAKVSTLELRSFMTIRQAERLVAALAVSARVQAQDAYQEPFDSPETVYRSCIDMQSFGQEVLRVILLDCKTNLQS
jgi:hypothetical protein